MDVNDPRFETYEQRFRALADAATLVKVAEPSLNATRCYLFLYGENGLTPEEEFEVLDKLASEPPEQLKRLEVDTDYWQDIALFVI
jgi:hypothetical protein